MSSHGVLCKCGYGMYAVGVLVIHDSLNGNIFCDVEFVCDECKKRKYIRCSENNVLKAKTKNEYCPCLEKREIILQIKEAPQ
jgi:hypothetical protein